MRITDFFIKTNRKKPILKSFAIPTALELEGFSLDCSEGNNESVKTFLEKYSASYVDRGGKYGWSPLRLASWRGHSQTVALLKEAQARQRALRSFSSLSL